MTYWNTKSIEGMEETARGEAEFNCNKRVKGQWLEVTLHAARGPVDEYFTYTYNNKPISRERASAIIQEA